MCRILPEVPRKERWRRANKRQPCRRKRLKLMLKVKIERMTEIREKQTTVQLRRKKDKAAWVTGVEYFCATSHVSSLLGSSSKSMQTRLRREWQLSANRVRVNIVDGPGNMLEDLCKGRSELICGQQKFLVCDAKINIMNEF